MTGIEKKLNELKKWSEQAKDNFLTIYANVDPSKPENQGDSWKTRIKNSLKEIPEIRNRDGKRDQTLYDLAINLIDELRPEARTFALFIHRDIHDKIYYERLDLQIDIPVVDIANGRIQARYGEPYLTPLWFAVDEYERTGILLLSEKKWRFFEIFLGEIVEDNELFNTIASDDWKTLKEINEKISQELDSRALKPGGRFDKLSYKERSTARLSPWIQKLYKTLGRLLEKSVDQLHIDRIILVGENWQTGYFETFLSKRIQQKIIANVTSWPGVDECSPQTLWRKIEPIVIDHERKKELMLIKEIKDQPGLWGIDEVLNAVQMGRVKTWVLPWSLNINVWICNTEKLVSSSREILEQFCDSPKLVQLREIVIDLASEFGANIEFVRGDAEKQLIEEMNSMAALLRW